jgi:hypothetical protein
MSELELCAGRWMDQDANKCACQGTGWALSKVGTWHKCSYHEGIRPEEKATKIKIVVAYRSVDGYRKTRTFNTLKGAQRFAQKMIGKNPTISASRYAVSNDGVGVVRVNGVDLYDLFPEFESCYLEC